MPAARLSDFRLVQPLPVAARAVPRRRSARSPPAPVNRPANLDRSLPANRSTAAARHRASFWKSPPVRRSRWGLQEQTDYSPDERLPFVGDVAAAGC